MIRCFAALLLGALAVPSAFAQRAGDRNEEERAAPMIGEQTGRILNEAIELLNMDDYAGARAALQDLRIDRLSPYERSRVEQILSNLDYAEEKYDSAREHLRLALESGGLNEQEASQVRFQIAQLFVAEERWAEAAESLEEWFATAQNPNSAAYYLLAVSYYQLNDLDRAFPAAQKAVELADQPQASWVELLVAIYIDRDEYEEALPYVERLVELQPKNKQHWLRLSSFYQEVERFGDALASIQIPYNAGMLSEDSEYMRLADLLMFNEIPYRAATVLEKGLEEGVVNEDADAYEKLANSWIAARDFDRAIPPLERAAQLSDDGDLYVRLAEVHVQREDWQAAAAALENGLEKGGLSDEGDAQILMGVALYSDGRPQEALEWFQRARRSDAHRDVANQYIKLIESEAG
ncbi:MAG TPA: tetratricopeptide repeat protein [Burkholderiales bacterium]